MDDEARGQGTAHSATSGAAHGVERIALLRAMAVITRGSIAVRPSRATIIGPLVQAALAVLASLLIVSMMDRLPLWVLAVLLIFVIIAGPTAVLGIVYQIAGTSFLMERAKGTARWQQGFLGLGLGTRELTPFTRIKRIEVVSDFESELPSGDLQDVVRWDVRLIKDNDRVLEIGAISAARSLADEALERANDLARAVAEMAGVEARTAALPEWALLDDEELDALLDDLEDDETAGEVDTSEISTHRDS